MYIFELISDSDNFILTRPPYNWQDISIKYTRHPKYKGFFIEFSPEKLTFLCNGGGKEFIENEYKSKGLNARITLTIKYKCDTNNYIEIFNGILDFRTYELADVEGYEAVSINIYSNDISYKVLNRDRANIDLSSTTSIENISISPLGTYENYILNLCSQKLILEGQVGYDQQKQINLNSWNDGNPPQTYFVMGGIQQAVAIITHDWQIISGELQTINQLNNLLDFTSIQQGYIQPIYIADNPNIFPDTLQINIEFSGTFSEAVNQSISRIASLNLWIAYGSDVNNLTMIQVYSQNFNSSVPDSFQFNISYNTAINLNQGDIVYIYWTIPYTITAGGGAGTEVHVDYNFIYDVADISLKVESIYPPTDCRGWLIYEAANRIIENITDRTNVLKSNILGRKNSYPSTYPANGCASFLYVTNGYALRGFNNDVYERPLYLSFETLFDIINSIYNIGAGVEGDNLVIEEVEYFYDKNLHIADIGTVRATRIILTESIYNKIVVGYNIWKIKDYNGLYEFNNKKEFILKSKIENEYDIVCPAIAGGSLIETTRRFEVEKYPTTDTDTDENIFIICVNRSRDQQGIPTNLNLPEGNNIEFSVINHIDDTADCIYNIRISPKRNLLRHLNLINAGLIYSNGDLYKLTYSEGNEYFGSTDQTETVQGDICPGDYSGQLLFENSDFSAFDPNIRNAQPLYIPELYTFEKPLSVADYLNIKSNITGYITANIFKQNIKLFIKEMTYNLFNSLAEFKCIPVNETVTQGFVNLQSLLLDGATEYVDFGNSPDFSFGDGVTERPFSIEFWIKTFNINKIQGIITKVASSNYEYRIQFTNQRIYFELSSANGLDWIHAATSQLQENTWYHIVATYNATGNSNGINIYVNGQNDTQIRNSSGTYTPQNNRNNTLKIGQFLNNYFFYGLIDEVAFYNDALNPLQVVEAYNNGTPPDKLLLSFSHELIEWWRFQSTAGDSTAPGGKIKGIYGHDGTPINTSAGNLVNDIP